MLDNVFVFKQSSIKIVKDKIIYFDPYKMDKEFHDADIIFITHDHYDHFDINSIKKVMSDKTYIVIPETLSNSVSEIFDSEKIKVVLPLNDYVVDDISFSTIPSYNINKQFHPKSNNWLGYLVNIDNKTYYIMGDTDDIPEARNVSCDVLFIPIGGTYTMDYKEAVNFTNYIKPKIAVPIHYAEVVGTFDDAMSFINNLDKNIKGAILIPKK